MLADVLIKVAAQVFEEENPTYKYRPRPSSAGPERCIRQMTYHALGVPPKPLPGRAAVVLNDSSWHEELTADLLRQSAFFTHSEQMPITIPNAYPWRPDDTWECKVCKELNMPDCNIHHRDCHGHLDYLVTDMTNIDYLVEHKALSHFGFEKLRTLEEMPWDYFTQQSIYLRGCQIVNPDLENGILLVKNKNQSGYLEFCSRYESETDTLTVYKYTHHTGESADLNVVIPNITNDAFEKFRQVEHYAENKTLPYRQYNWDHWRCNYCQYGETCWKGYVEEQQKLAQNVIFQTDEFIRLVDKERAAHKRESEAKKDKEALRSDIKAALKDSGVRHGFTDKYEIDWQAETKKTLDKELLDPAVKLAATVDVISETLRIKNKKKTDSTTKKKSTRKKTTSKKTTKRKAA